MKYTGINLLRELSLAFGPSGCEDAVRALITEQIKGECDNLTVDKTGNLIAVVRGRGNDYNKQNPRRVMLSAHMDEVGFMITAITEEGYLKFATVGGIDPRVLCGRHMLVGDDTRRYHGVIASKAIHLQSGEERGKTMPVDKLYIDIGARDADEAKKYVSVGDFAVFDSDFVPYGKDNSRIKSKALDDRAGCAILIEVMRDLFRNPCDMPFDVYFAFTTCEEVGFSGAKVAAFGIEPDTAIVLEATAVNDLPGVGRFSVSKQGDGPTLTMADVGTIYDMGFVNYALQTAEAKGLKCQIKRTMTGSTDASHIQRSFAGVRVLGMSLPTRYIHSASCVALYSDYEQTRDLISAMLRDWKLD